MVKGNIGKGGFNNTTMRQITIRIDDEQFKELQEISEAYRIKNVSWLIRRAIDYYVTSHRKEEIP